MRGYLMSDVRGMPVSYKKLFMLFFLLLASPKISPLN
jgi:hypothetical protein